MPHAHYENANQSLQSGATLILLYRIADVVHATGLCRSKIYELIAAGELETAHFGRAVRVTAESLHTLIARRIEPARKPAAPSETRAPTGRKPPVRKRAKGVLPDAPQP